MKQPPAIQNPDEAAEANKILAREHSVPRGQEDLSDIKEAHKEEIEPPPKQLDKEKLWFFPALAYSMMQMDRSLFEIYSWALKKDVPVTTYRTDEPIALFDGADVTRNSWFHTIQGIDPDYAGFIDYIKTYRFNDARRQLSWCLEVIESRIADPFFDGDVREGIDCYFLMPVCLTSDRRVVITQCAGLQLGTTHIGIEVPEQDAV